MESQLRLLLVENAQRDRQMNDLRPLVSETVIRRRAVRRVPGHSRAERARHRDGRENGTCPHSDILWPRVGLAGVPAPNPQPRKDYLPRGLRGRGYAGPIVARMEPSMSSCRLGPCSPVAVVDKEMPGSQRPRLRLLHRPAARRRPRDPGEGIPAGREASGSARAEWGGLPGNRFRVADLLDLLRETMGARRPGYLARHADGRLRRGGHG
jgi:hypothetical protein